jgi:hypothetical protein
MWRQLVDDAGQHLRQLLEEFLFRHPRSLGEGLEDVRPKRVADLARRNRFVRPVTNPGVGCLSLSTLRKRSSRPPNPSSRPPPSSSGGRGPPGWVGAGSRSLPWNSAPEASNARSASISGLVILPWGTAEPNISSSRPIFCSCCCRVETDAVVSHRSPPAEGVINP